VCACAMQAREVERENRQLRRRLVSLCKTAQAERATFTALQRDLETYQAALVSLAPPCSSHHSNTDKKHKTPPSPTNLIRESSSADTDESIDAIALPSDVSRKAMASMPSDVSPLSSKSNRGEEDEDEETCSEDGGGVGYYAVKGARVQRDVKQQHERGEEEQRQQRGEMQGREAKGAAQDSPPNANAKGSLAQILARIRS
jgi:hypothetical protein